MTRLRQLPGCASTCATWVVLRLTSIATPSRRVYHDALGGTLVGIGRLSVPAAPAILSRSAGQRRLVCDHERAFGSPLRLHHAGVHSA